MYILPHLEQSLEVKCVAFNGCENSAIALHSCLTCCRNLTHTVEWRRSFYQIRDHLQLCKEIIGWDCQLGIAQDFRCLAQEEEQDSRQW